MNIPIGGIKDIDCNTKSNLLIISVLPFIEFPISGLGEPEIYQNLVWITRKWGDRVVIVSF